MKASDYERKLEELDQLLNDPDVPMEPDRVWSLLAKISRHDLELVPRERDEEALPPALTAAALPRSGIHGSLQAR
jgi:hypothetical protein